MFLFYLLCVSIGLLDAQIHAQTTTEGTSHQQIHFESFAQQRYLNQEGFASRSQQSEGFFLTDYGWSWTTQTFFFEIKPQLRGVQSPGVGADAGNPLMATAATTPRWLNSRRLMVRNQDQEVYFDFDRLNARYGFSMGGEGVDGEIYVGRRPLSLGTLRLFPIWNKLTLPLIFQPGPEWIENPDGYGAKVQLHHIGLRTFAVRGTNPHDDNIYLAELNYSPGVIETQILIADRWKRTALGIAATADYLDASWRLEALSFSRERDSTLPSGEEQNQWGLGFERALGSRWVLDVEYMQQSYCSDLHSGYASSTPNRLQALNGCRYIFPYLDFQLNSVWRLGGGFLLNLGDPSGMSILSADYSFYESLSLQCKGKWAVGSDKTEFGSARYVDLYGRSAGAQSTIYVGLSYTD